MYCSLTDADIHIIKSIITDLNNKKCIFYKCSRILVAFQICICITKLCGK